MEFYMGGYAQGKLRYVLKQHEGEKLTVVDGVDGAENIAKDGGRIILNHFHLWIRKMMQEYKEPGRPVNEFIEKHGDCIIISDEVGNGIVPISQQERDYREQVGRLQIELAARAERVERVICGIGQRLK